MKSFDSHFPVVQTFPLETCQTQEWLMPWERWPAQGASDKLRCRKGLWGQDTRPFSWAPWEVPRQSQTCCVRPRDPRPHLARSRREAVTLRCKEVGYSSAWGGARDGSQLHECLAKRGRLVRSVFKDFSLSPWTFSSGLGFVATNWILVFQTAWAAASSWKESYPLLFPYSLIC